MNHSGDAAEQVLHLTLEGAEFVLRISGKAAKEIAVLLYAILSQQKKTKGRARMETMLRAGPTEIFSVQKKDMPKFVKEAGRYGVLYCGIHNPKSGPNDPVDFMVRQEDAAKINRIVEKFKFASVEEIASVKADIVQSREGAAPDAADRGVMDKAEQDKLLDDLFAKPVQKEASAPENPTAAKAEPSASKTETAPPSGPTSKAPEKPEKDTSSRERRSVREDLKEIHAERAKKADEAGRASAAPDKAKKPAAKAPRHQQPKPKAPRKPKAR